MTDKMLACGKGALVDSLGLEQDVMSLAKLPIAGDGIKNVALTGDNAYILYQNGTIRAYLAEKDMLADCELRNVLKDIKIMNIYAGVHGQVFVIDENGKAYAWGCNDHEQLGLTDADDFVSLPMSVPFTDKKKVVQVACGNTHTLILLKNGDLFSMGDNEYGQLGLKNKCPVKGPERITTLENVPILRIAAGGWHSFCLSLTGILYSWGRNNFGQLGVGDFMDHSSPLIIKMSTKLPIAYVSAGDYHSALLTREGQMFSFGLGTFGQLGHGVPCNNESKPKQVEEFSESVVTQIACGQNHTIAFSPDCKQIFAFGSCSDGQLGIGIKKDKISDPIMVNIPQSSDENGNKKVKQVFACGSQTVVLKSFDADILQQQDFRILDSDQHILTLDENFCTIISKLPRNSKIPADVEEKLISIISSQKCFTGSFHLEVLMNEFVSRSLDFDKVKTLLSLIFKSKNEAIEKLIAKVFCDNVLSRRSKEDPDTESLKFFFLMPFLIAPIKCVVSRAKCLFLFIRKLVTMKAKCWRELSSWYKTSSSAFSTLVKLCYRHIDADGLIKKFEVLCDAAQNELNLVKKLHQLNSEQHIIPYDEFYLPVKFSQDILNDQMSQKKLKKNPLIFSCPFMFSGEAKRGLLYSELSYAQPLFYFEPLFNQLTVNTENVFEDAIEQMDTISQPAWPLSIVFKGEEGLVYKGLPKEFFRLVFQEISQHSCELFTEDEVTHVLWFSDNNDATRKYYFIGMLCGFALYNDAIISMNFPLALYKKLQGIETNLDDFRQIFPSFGRCLQELIDFEENGEETVQAKYDFYFVSTSGEPLKKGGQHLAVTKSNRNEYVKLQVDYVLNKSVKKQFDSFKKGFERVCTSPIMELFRPEELMEVLAYKPNLDWKKLQKHAVVNAVSDTFKQVCEWFWEIVHHMTEEDKVKLLIFLTGTDRVPLLGLHDTLKIYEVFDGEGNSNDDILPAVFKHVF